jgi:tetratricopeptide (TPR) repeat protein
MTGKDGSPSGNRPYSPGEQGPVDRGAKGGRGVNFVVLALIVCALIAIGYIVFTPRETPLGKAISLVKSNKAALAVPLLEDLARQNPSELGVYPWLAQAYLATDRFAEGRTALDTAVRVHCHDASLPAVVDSYSTYYQNHKHFSEAEQLYDSALQVVDRNSIAASRGHMYLRWAEDEMATGDVEGALLHLGKANEFAPALEEPLRSQVPHKLVDCYRQLAAIAETRDKDDVRATGLLEKSLKVADEPSSRLALAGLYSKRKDVDKAIENYDCVCKQDANNLEARHRLVDLLIEKKDLVHAQDALTELVDKEKSFENYELLAGINLKLQNYAGAVRSLEEACALRPKAALLKQLLGALNSWSAELTADNKSQEAMSVKGHAERVAEQLAQLLKEEKKDEPKADAHTDKWNPGTPPVSIVSSRNWLAGGSYTPEGEIKIKNISGEAVSDLALTAVFYDNTKRRNNGSVTLPVANGASPPFAPGAERTLYFSCPNIVRDDHQLAVIILWKGKFLKEFPVVKQH